MGPAAETLDSLLAAGESETFDFAFLGMCSGLLIPVYPVPVADASSELSQIHESRLDSWCIPHAGLHSMNQHLRFICGLSCTCSTPSSACHFCSKVLSISAPDCHWAGLRHALHHTPSTCVQMATSACTGTTLSSCCVWYALEASLWQTTFYGTAASLTMRCVLLTACLNFSAILCTSELSMPSGHLHGAEHCSSDIEGFLKCHANRLSSLYVYNCQATDCRTLVSTMFPTRCACLNGTRWDAAPCALPDLLKYQQSAYQSIAGCWCWSAGAWGAHAWLLPERL